MKVVVSIMPKSLDEARALNPKDYQKVDLVEWRSDFIEYSDLFEAASIIFQKFCAERLIFTLRTVSEGGQMDLDSGTYISLLQNIQSQFSPAYIDFQYYSYASVYHQVNQWQNLILSYHNFTKVPEDISERFQQLTDLSPAVVKVAVMPQKASDVLHLMMLTRRFSDENPEQVYVSMAMGKLGKVSRLAGDLSASSWTFASLNAPSAPGQIGLLDLLTVKEILDAD